MFGRKSKNRTAKRSSGARKRKALLALILLPVIYVAGSGPALWSRANIANRGWKKGVIYYVAPLMWLNQTFREPSLIEKIGAVDLTPSRNTGWYDHLEKYWSLFGRDALSEANKITMMLKIEFR